MASLNAVRYKLEHAEDLDAGVNIAAPIHPADWSNANTLNPSLKAAVCNLAIIGLTPKLGKQLRFNGLHAN